MDGIHEYAARKHCYECMEEIKLEKASKKKKRKDEETKKD